MRGNPEKSILGKRSEVSKRPNSILKHCGFCRSPSVVVPGEHRGKAELLEALFSEFCCILNVRRQGWDPGACPFCNINFLPKTATIPGTEALVLVFASDTHCTSAWLAACCRAGNSYYTTHPARHSTEC